MGIGVDAVSVQLFGEEMIGEFNIEALANSYPFF